MAITERSILRVGTRVKVRRATLPVDPALIGRTGTVVDATPYRPHQYGIVLDGEEEVRMLAPAELEPIGTPALPPDNAAPKKLRALP